MLHPALEIPNYALTNLFKTLEGDMSLDSPGMLS